ncbi:MAG: hypothetical protein RI925_490 [Pseudomonadota bacterium]
MNWLKRLKGPSKATAQTEHLVPFDQQPAITVDVDAHSPARWGMMVLGIGFGGFLLWAAFAPLDAGVSSQGTVKVASNRKTIQHLTGGIVDAIEVKEGQAVKKNQVLVRLNPTNANAQLGIVQAQYLSAQSSADRLAAERDGKPTITFSSMLTEKFAGDSRAKEAMALQTQLFTSRRAALQAELGMLRENSQGTQEQLKGLESLKQSREQQLAFVNEELKGVRDMAAQGYVPRNRMLQLERTVSEISGQLAETIANIGRTKNALSELKLRMLQREKEYQKEVETQLNEVQKEARAQADRLAALEYEMANTQIKSPIDGVVVGINMHTVGGVIQPGFHIMDVVPQNEPMIVETKVATNLIDKVHPGLPVDLSFPAFSHAHTPNVPGVVDTVGADVLTDEVTRMPYYSVQVKVTADGMKTLGSLQIRPGMPAAVVVKTGERTMLNYLVKPMIDRVSGAFKEE